MRDKNDLPRRLLEMAAAATCAHPTKERLLKEAEFYELTEGEALYPAPVRPEPK